MDVIEQRKLSLVVAALLGVGLSGCVVNPYIRSTSAPLQASAEICRNWQDTEVQPADSVKYATCLRRVMEDKASRYAFMNNGGSAALLGVTGLAAYRGFRGGHQANIAALTTGGAAIYGAQQYLYRKPREAIYWSGANALGCAIALTQKRIIPDAEIVPLEELRDGPVVRANSGVTNALMELETKRASCDPALPTAVSAAVETRVDKLQQRRLSLQQRLARLKSSSQSAKWDLIAATDAITSSVNSQLAMEMPDPAELAGLLTSLKLPALEPTDAPKPALNLHEVAKRVASTSRGKPPADTCAADDNAVMGLDSALSRLEDSLNTLETGLKLAESSIGRQGEGAQSIKSCYNPPGIVLMPFTLHLPPGGIVKVKANESTTLRITGGTAPYSAAPTTRAQDLTIDQVEEGGDYAFKITAGEDASAGRIPVLAMDATGSPRLIQIEVE